MTRVAETRAPAIVLTGRHVVPIGRHYVCQWPESHPTLVGAEIEFRHALMKTVGMPSRTKRVRQRPLPDSGQQDPRVEERLLAAIERLLEDGHKFAALTVEQLAREAGIGRATFYLHFRDKGELVHRLMRRLTAEVIGNAGVWFGGSGGEIDRRSMQLALHGIVSTFKKHQAVLAAVADTAPFDASVAAAHAQMMDELCRLSRKAISQIKRDGRATAAAGPDLADLLTWFLELYCARFIAAYEGKQVSALIDLFAHVCGNAIFGEAAPATAAARRRR